MGRPTDPAKLAALRARQAANSRAYRMRKAAEKTALPQSSQPRKRQAPSSETAVERAHIDRADARTRRNEVVGGLTSARNPSVNIYTPREAPRAPAGMPKTAAERRQRIKIVRENTQAHKLQNIGREAKGRIRNILETDARGESIRENLKDNPAQYRRLQAAFEKISSVSQQTLAILLRYEGGENELQSALTQLAYPKESDTEDMVGRIETLAEYAERGEQQYGPKAVGRLRV